MSEPARGLSCHLHPDREANIVCQRCDRPICPACMNEASVGFQCPNCVREGAATVRAPRTIGGGTVERRPGIVTYTLIAINVLVFLAQQRFDQVDEQGAMLAFGFFVSSDGEALRGVADGGYWRLITAAFLHANLIHLVLNMVGLYFFGPFVERALGAGRFIVVYLVSAVVSSVFVFVLSPPETLTVGASGVVFALFGIALVLLWRARENVTSLLVVLAINGVFSLQSGISWQGHLGGLVAGLLIASAIAFSPRERRQVALLGTLGLLVVGSVVAVVLRSNEVNSMVTGALV